MSLNEEKIKCAESETGHKATNLETHKMYAETSQIVAEQVFQYHYHKGVAEALFINRQ